MVGAGPQRPSRPVRDHSPTPFVSGVSATAIALGFFHTCAIESGGGIKCWGYNGKGPLGIGSKTDQTRPVDVPGGRGEGKCVVCVRARACAGRARALVVVDTASAHACCSDLIPSLNVKRNLSAQPLVIPF